MKLANSRFFRFPGFRRVGSRQGEQAFRQREPRQRRQGVGTDTALRIRDPEAAGPALVVDVDKIPFSRQGMCKKIRMMEEPGVQHKKSSRPGSFRGVPEHRPGEVSIFPPIPDVRSQGRVHGGRSRQVDGPDAVLPKPEKLSLQ